VPPEIDRRARVSFGYGQSTPHLPLRSLGFLGGLLNILLHIHTLILDKQGFLFSVYSSGPCMGRRIPLKLKL
jgi:hypothetical protein